MLKTKKTLEMLPNKTENAALLGAALSQNYIGKNKTNQSNIKKALLNEKGQEKKPLEIMSTDCTVPLYAIQNGEIGILKYIKNVCDQNGLTYFLAYGTLIGAVRHQGFVPWDDDVDIHMPRNDYLKFVKIVQDDPHPYYRLISMETTPRFTLTTAKVIDTRTVLTQVSPCTERVRLGIFVDIFILDGAGDTQEEAEETYKKAYDLFCAWYKAVMKMFYPGTGWKKTLLLWIKHTPERAAGIRYWLEKMDKFNASKAYEDCVFVGALGACTPEPARNIWKREWFGEGTSVVFNGDTFRAPCNWDAVLRPEYGDYMTLPTPEERKPHHYYHLEIPDPAVLEELSQL